VRSAEDVLEALAEHIGAREPAPVAPKADAPVAQIEGMAARLLSLLGAAPVAEDALIREMALPAASVSAILLDLELAGQVRRHPGAMISLI
jgi:DNA processing protein